MTTHTPGPWHVGIEPTLNTIRIRDNGLDALRLATIFYSDGGKPRYQREEATANARLIAAAPDLLDLAKRQDKHIQELDRLTRSIDLGCHPDARNLVAAMTAVIRLAAADHPNGSASDIIAKAEGK